MAVKIDDILYYQFFEQVWKDRPDLLKSMRELKEYSDCVYHETYMRQRIRKITKLRNESRKGNKQ